MNQSLNQSFHDFIHRPNVGTLADAVRAHYARTGQYRPDDLRRLLGDPCRGVSVPMRGHEEAARAYLSRWVSGDSERG